MAQFGPFMDSPGGYSSRRPRRLLWIVMLALLVVVLFVVFKVIPQPTEILSDRSANKALKEARALEEQSLNLYAAEKYARIVDSARVKPDLRLQAARGLARTARASGRLWMAEAALEKAYALSPPGSDQAAVRDELELLRGRPLSVATDAPTSGAAALASAAVPNPGAVMAAADGSPYPLPAGARVLARIGGERVSMEEISYAWQRFNGYRKPSEEEFKIFIRNYIDLVLMADEARGRGLEQQEDTLYNLRVQRVLGLNQALQEKLIRDLKTPEREELEGYYQAHLALFSTPAKALLGHILVSDDGDAALVKKALGQNQSFAKVAQKYGKGANKLKDGYILGEISENDPGIPGFGPNPPLIRRLLAMSDGATTGPLRTPQGLQFITIVEKTRAKARPFGEVEENVLLHYQKQQLAAARQELLQRLRQERPMEIEDPKLREVVLEARAAGDATTATLVTAPAGAATTTTLETPPAVETAETTASTNQDSPNQTAGSASDKKSGKDR